MIERIFAYLIWKEYLQVYNLSFLSDVDLCLLNILIQF